MGTVKLAGREVPLNQKFDIQIGDETVSPTGQKEIRRYLREMTKMKTSLPKDWDFRDVVQSGQYRGRFANRVSSFYYKKHEMRLVPEVLNRVGSLAAQHMRRSGTLIADITDQFGWRSGDFGDGGSCFWGGREDAKDIMRYYGTLAVRFYQNDAPERGRARAWLVPNRIDNDGFIVFNGYGIEGDPTLSFASTLSSWLGVEYKKIELLNEGRWDKTIYINGGGIGYIIGDSASLRPHTAIDLNFAERNPKCLYCNHRATTEEQLAHTIDGNWYCDSHWATNVRECGNCHEHRMDIRSDRALRGAAGNVPVCQECYRNAEHCEICERRYIAGTVTHLTHITVGRVSMETARVCPDCVGRLTECRDCHNQFIPQPRFGGVQTPRCMACADAEERRIRQRKEALLNAAINERRRALEEAARLSGQMDDADETTEFYSNSGDIYITDSRGNVINSMRIELNDEG